VIRTWLWILLVLLLHRELGNRLLAAKLTPPGTMPVREERRETRP
jgi:hypothetical protein